MIVYHSNKNWLRDITHLYKSWTMTKVLRAVFLIGVYTAIICFLDYKVFDTLEMGMSTQIFSLLGVVLSILLVFRTNTAYDRWWEGRKQWGALVNHTRNLAISTDVTFPAELKQERKQMAIYISNFCIALKEHLRDGTKLEEFISVSEEELKNYAEKGHIPNHISQQIYRMVQHHYKGGHITGEDILNFKPQLQALLDILGACERIKKTPIPFSYNVYLKIFITVYGLLLPFAVIPEFGFVAIPVVMFIFFAFIGVELMAEEIEDPFGLDCNDLPTGDIAHTIKNNVFEILDHKSSLGKIHQKEEYQKIF